MPTVNQLLTEIRDSLAEPIAAQWQDPMLVRWINEAGRDLARATRHLKDTATITTTANVSEYDVPDNVIAIEHAYYSPDGARQRPLTARHYEGMDAVWGEWQNQARSEPEFFTTMGYSPNLKIKLYPAPASGSKTVTLIVSRTPAEIAFAPIVPSATADVPAHWYDALVLYVEAKALRRDRDPRWSEARQLYTEVRDNLVNNPDYLAVNREVVPSASGYLPRWLTEFDD